MKRFIVLFTFLLITFVLSAQTGFHMLPNVVEGIGDTGNLDIKIRADVVNETDTTIEVGWERIVMEMPDVWSTYVCSDITCAPPSAFFGSFLLPPNDTVNLDCHFLPEATAGNGKVILKLFPIPDTSRVLLMEYNCRVELTSAQNNFVDNSNIFIYPNPTKNDVTIVSSRAVQKISILNSLGQQVKEIRSFENDQYSLIDLPAGQYFLFIEEKNGNKKEAIPLLKL